MSGVSSARQTGKLTGDEHPQTQLRVSEESEVGLIPSTQKPQQTEFHSKMVPLCEGKGLKEVIPL